MFTLLLPARKQGCDAFPVFGCNTDLSQLLLLLSNKTSPVAARSSSGTGVS